MKVYRIWIENKQEWLITNKAIWSSKANAKGAIAYMKRYASFKTWVFKIFEYELTNEREII